MRKVLFILALATVWYAPAHAQNDSLRSRTLEEVVVTATKFPKSLSETGKVLIVLDESQLNQSAGKDLSQLLNEQAGIVVNGATSNPGKDRSVYVRGASNKYTLVLLDGVPLNDPSGIDGGAYDLRLLPLSQIERIEILKGSQSTLYGSDAIAGVINILTKKGSDKTFGGTGLLSYGSYNTWKGNASIAGKMKGVDYTVGYSHFDTDGISEAKEVTGAGTYDKDGATQNSFQVNLGVKASEKLSIHPFFRYNTFNGSFDNGAYQDSKINHTRSALLNTGLRAQYQLRSGALTAMYGYTGSSRSYAYEFGSYDYQGKFQNAELFWNHSFSEHVQLMAGINHQIWKMSDTTAIEKDPSIAITSPYFSFFIKNVKGLNVEIGARHTIHSKYGNNLTWSFNPSYWLRKEIKLFFNYSTGFKAPMLGQLFGQYGANPNLKPEKSESVEAGIQLISPNKKLEVRAVVFTRDVKDVIIYNSQFQYVNFNQQHDYGFEIEPAIHLNHLTVKAFYAFVDGQVTTTTAAGTDTTYNNLIRRPKNSIGVSVGYQLHPKMFVSVGLKTVGKRNDQYYDSDFALQRTVLQAYQLLDVYIDYKVIESVRFFIDAKNLLNQDYMEVAGYNALRANINLGVIARF